MRANIPNSIAQPLQKYQIELLHFQINLTLYTSFHFNEEKARKNKTFFKNMCSYVLVCLIIADSLAGCLDYSTC